MSGGAALLSHLVAAFPDGSRPARLGVAVSGGSDSLGLLHLLCDWGRASLSVATVDHGLRPEAGREAAAVAGICAGLGLAHATLRWTGWDGAGNLQDQARRARYRLLADWAAAEGIGDVTLGHTLDDQAETFLLGLSRGAGLDGLTGMRPVFVRAGVRFHRPLLGVRRQALRDNLAARGVRWVEDPSNEDARFDRVRARRALAALAPLGIDAKGLGRTIANLRSTRASIAAYLAGWARRHVAQDRGDLLLEGDAYHALPEDFARRLLNAALRWISGADYPPRADAVMQVILRGQRQRRTTLHGCVISFRGPGIRISREPRAAKGAEPALPGAIWDGRWQITGPELPGAETRALTEAGLADCPDWRASGLPRASLAASPAIWRGGELISAPLAGYANGWQASLAPGRDDFAASLIRR